MAQYKGFADGRTRQRGGGDPVPGPSPTSRGPSTWQRHAATQASERCSGRKARILATRHEMAFAERIEGRHKNFLRVHPGICNLLLLGPAIQHKCVKWIVGCGNEEKEGKVGHAIVRISQTDSGTWMGTVPCTSAQNYHLKAPCLII